MPTPAVKHNSDFVCERQQSRVPSASRLRRSVDATGDFVVKVDVISHDDAGSYSQDEVRIGRRRRGDET